MKVFDAYSAYYDLLYGTKDYSAEVDYVAQLMSRYKTHYSQVLELGCGTGLHASLLAKKVISVHGVDQSETMLAGASERKKNLPADVASRLTFTKGDIRAFRTDARFDVVISLFHVMSYMNSDEDLVFAFHTAAKHLAAGGIFIFDCWHGPGVLHDKPASRTKKFENEKISVTRISYPDMLAGKNIVNVRFDISIKDMASGSTSKLEEIHDMRYLFPEEIIALAKQTHFEMICAEEWLTGSPLSEESWNACYVCRKIN